MLKHGNDALLLAVEEVLNTLRPAMQADGGDVELVSIEQCVVAVRLKGTCLFCPSASLTLSRGIESTLKARFSEIEKVVSV